MIRIINIQITYINCFMHFQLKMQKNNSLKIVAISDTHGQMHQLNKILNQEGDIFIHAGDFTYYGIQNDFKQFFDFLDKLKFKHKIVVSGNHQIMIDPGHIQQQLKKEYLSQFKCSLKRNYIIDQLKKRAIYLEHQFVQIQGLKIFGSPYTPFYCGSAFQYNKKDAQIIWDQIPQNLDILITHGPAYHILDKNTKLIHAGCQVLKKHIDLKRPKCHIFGHIHQGYGKIKIMQTTHYNVAYKPTKIQF